jgi:hypothetical protein
MSIDLIDALVKHLKTDYDAFIMLQSREDYDGNLKAMSNVFGFDYINKDNLLNVIFAFLSGTVEVAYSTKTPNFKGNFIQKEGTVDVIIYRPIFINLVKDKNIEIIERSIRYNLAPKLHIYDIEGFNETHYDDLCQQIEDLFNPLKMRLNPLKTRKS